MIKSTDRAYAAGYIDGDGCFSLAMSRKKFISNIIIVSTNKNILEWFKSIWDGTIGSAKQILNQKTVHRLTISRRQSAYLAQDIAYFLIEKLDEIDIFMKFIVSDNKDMKKNCIQEIKTIKKRMNLVNREMKQLYEKDILTIEPTEDDFAYLAGFIDAECCLSIQRYTIKYKPNAIYKTYLSCNNTKAPVFKWLLSRFGGRINFINRSSKNLNHRDQLSWRVSGKMLHPILKQILPFLKYKKPVCQELIKFYQTTLPNGGARHTETFRKSYANVLREREVIVHKVHLLNLKGTR